MLAIDASIAVDLCLSPKGFAPLRAEQLVAPPLLFSETLSALHEMRWRGEIPEDMGELALSRYADLPVTIKEPSALKREAWRLADALGLGKDL